MEAINPFITPNVIASNNPIYPRIKPVIAIPLPEYLFGFFLILTRAICPNTIATILAVERIGDPPIIPHTKLAIAKRLLLFNAFLTIFKHCIDIGYSSVPYNDYDVWVVAVEDINGNEIYRKDIGNDEITRIKNDPDGYCKVWVSFDTKIKPHKWLVWPHSLEHGWAEKITGTL